MAALVDLAEQVRRGVPGIVHDHMHWEDGKLVEDTPATNPGETNSDIE